VTLRRKRSKAKSRRSVKEITRRFGKAKKGERLFEDIDKTSN